MANTHKGKFLFVLILLSTCAFSSRILANLSSDSTQVEPKQKILGQSSHLEESEVENKKETNPQKVLLNKLEELVRNLSEIVVRLEPLLQESTKVSSLDRRQHQELNKSDQRRRFSGGGDVEGGSKDGNREKVVSVTKYSPFWSERFQFVSAVRLDSDATCINVLPFRDYEGLSKYVAVGDDRGRVYLFLRNGDVVVDFYTECDSPVTAMVSYLSAHKNQSVVVTGHHNGVIMMHKVYDRSGGEDWNSVSMENVGRLLVQGDEEEGFAVSILEVHHVGRLRYILSSDVIGKIRVFKENGTFLGSVVPLSKPLAFLKQKLLFLTESGAGSLDLRSMKIRESECEGLNHSLSQYYVFDATERSKAYGYTSDGDLIHVLLLGDIMNFKCRVRSKRKIDMGDPLALQTIKGYLLVVNEEKVFVFNVSSHHYVRAGGPRLLYSAGLNEIRSSFLNYRISDTKTGKRQMIPLVASDRGKLVILGFGSGYVGMYHSNLPVFKGDFNTMLWTSPVLFFILFLFGAWQFFAKKKEALTSWGPDDPFSSTSPPVGAPLTSAPGDRPFVDSSSRSADIMDLRTGGLRGPSRRYGSPSQYPGGATTSFRPSSTDANSRPSSVDSSFRPSSELKFRGPTLESGGFAKRRESLFINSQAGDENH